MRRLLIMIFALGLGHAATAQSLDECRRLARENYPLIRQYGLIAKTEAFDLSNARRAWLPQLSLNAQATWQSDVMALPDILSGVLAQQGTSMPGIKKDQYKVALDLNQTIWDGGKSRADREIVEAEAAERRLSADVDLYALEGRVNNLYFGILLLDERIAQTEAVIALLQSNLDRLRSLQRNGVAMQSDSDAVEAELLSVNQRLTEIAASRDSYRRMLEIFIGRELDATLARPDLTEPASQEVARPELELFDAKSEILSAREKLVKSSLRPRFSLFAQGYYGYPGLDMFESMRSSDWSWNALVGVRMSWNFGAFYTRKSNLQKLRTAQQQVDIQRDIFLFNTGLQTTGENGDIIRLKKALADDDRIVALRRSVREAAESKLKNGVIDTTDLLQKITDESNAATARSAREIELLKTIYELKHTLNR